MMIDNEIIKRDDCIAEKQAEIIRLQSMNQAKLDTIHDLQVEIERLKEFIVETRRCDKEIKSEARKEFAERLKEYATQGFWETDAYVGAEQIDNLLKEMVGDDNARDII